MDSQYDWHEVKPDVWTRTCLGHEGPTSFNQNVADGHTELSAFATFRLHRKAILDPSTEELDIVDRVKEAWIKVRCARPETAVELTTHTEPNTPQALTYRVLRNEQEIGTWVDQTLKVIRLGENGFHSVQEICRMTYNRKLPTSGKQSMLYLVLPSASSNSLQKESGTSNIDIHIIWNVSHAVVDGFSITQFFNSLFQFIVDAPAANTSTSSSRIYVPSKTELDVLPRLPRSSVVAYERRYKPLQQERDAALRDAYQNMSLIQEKMAESHALQPHPEWPTRKHETVCLLRELDQREALRLIAFAGRAGSGVTYLASAATLLATMDTYPTSISEAEKKGTLLGMVRNARRWINTEWQESADGQPNSTMSIPLASDVVFLWIPSAPSGTTVAAGGDGRQKNAQTLVKVAQRIKADLQPHLGSPHYISAFPHLCEAGVLGLKQQWDQIRQTQQKYVSKDPKFHQDVLERTELGKVIGPQAPGFSSIGVFKVPPKFIPTTRKDGKDALWLERIDITHYGRQVNASPWISMLALDGRLKFSLGFDACFHCPEKMAMLLDSTIAWLRACLAEPTNVKEAEIGHRTVSSPVKSSPQQPVTLSAVKALSSKL